jgi:hypothetical protein
MFEVEGFSRTQQYGLFLFARAAAPFASEMQNAATVTKGKRQSYLTVKHFTLALQLLLLSSTTAC